MCYIRDVSKPEMRRDACAYQNVINLFNSMRTMLMQMPAAGLHTLERSHDQLVLI